MRCDTPRNAFQDFKTLLQKVGESRAVSPYPRVCLYLSPPHSHKYSQCFTMRRRRTVGDAPWHASGSDRLGQSRSLPARSSRGGGRAGGSSGGSGSAGVSLSLGCFALDARLVEEGATLPVRVLLGVWLWVKVPDHLRAPRNTAMRIKAHLICTLDLPLFGNSTLCLACIQLGVLRYYCFPRSHLRLYQYCIVWTIDT